MKFLFAENNPSRPKHGHCPKSAPSRTYSSWTSMLNRCRNKKMPSYPYYGGRGIEVCERWHTFENFLADMGERPDGMTIDRVDNDAGYSPENCQWSSTTHQARHRGGIKLTADLVQEIHGRLEHGESGKSVAARFGISQPTVSNIRHGTTWPDQMERK